MKRTFTILILLLSLCVVGHTQTNPQFEFNAQASSNSILSNYEDDDYFTYFAIQLLLILGDNNNKEKVQLIHRLYEIEHTSLINYITDDGEPLNFMTDSDTIAEKTEVDFGTTLKANSSDFSGGFKLWFASPVTKIDPALFAPNVTFIKLPSSNSITYESSPTMCVTNLSYIDGPNVYDNSVLIDREGTLIVAAVAGITDFTIPNQVSKIGDRAFRGCTLNSITIPENVKSIGEGAFELCNQLENVTILSPNPIHICKSSFETDKGYKFKIYVPRQCYKAYRKAYPFLRKRFEIID